VPISWEAHLPEQSHRKRRVLAVANQKGGVGKTTTAVNLGASLAELGYRTLVIDLDPQANATTGLGLDPRSIETSMYDVILRELPLEDCIEPTVVKNLFVAPSSLDLAGAEIELVPVFSRERRLGNAVATVRDEYDFIFIDCPPSLGLLTLNALVAADAVLIPLHCEYFALEGLADLMTTLRRVRAGMNPDLDVDGVLLTMYDDRTNLGQQVAGEVREFFKSKVFQTVIPRNVKLAEAPSHGMPVPSRFALRRRRPPIPSCSCKPRPRQRRRAQ
jgi:chromosome partitioning protein